jgi:hypothetical protein
MEGEAVIHNFENIPPKDHPIQFNLVLFGSMVSEKKILRLERGPSQPNGRQRKL